MTFIIHVHDVGDKNLVIRLSMKLLHSWEMVLVLLLEKITVERIGGTNLCR